MSIFLKILCTRPFHQIQWMRITFDVKHRKSASQIRVRLLHPAHRDCELCVSSSQRHNHRQYRSPGIVLHSLGQDLWPNSQMYLLNSIFTRII